MKLLISQFTGSSWRCHISEDAHNPDGSPPSFVPAEIRAEYWEKRARRAEEQRDVIWRERNKLRQADEVYLRIFRTVGKALTMRTLADFEQAEHAIHEAKRLFETARD